ncbi:MAG: hypothetical protein LBP37_04215 [Spirochaetaceae bacterium]|jgi:hypothetical protein|nr:hypothetical protein [Spirochaetaceae bacterium]
METEKNFEPQIYELISDLDNVEKIRNHIAFIIKGETHNQYIIAQEQGEPDAEDYNFRVFIENARPYDTEGEPPIEPLINIMLQKTETADGNSRMGPQKYKAAFIIDCIAFGNDAGEDRDDCAAASRAWKAARVIRRILMSEQYLYLGLRGVIGGRLIKSIETGVPKNGGDALTVVTARITLEVQFIERSIGTAGPLIEAINFTVEPVDGEVINTSQD